MCPTIFYLFCVFMGVFVCVAYVVFWGVIVYFSFFSVTTGYKRKSQAGKKKRSAE